MKIAAKKGNLLNIRFGHQFESVVSDDINYFSRFHSFIGNAVFRFRRYHGVYLSVNETVGFQFSKLGRQHFIGDMFQAPFKFAVPHYFIFQTPKNGHFPSPSYPVHRKFYGIVIGFSIINKIRHNAKILKNSILSKMLVSYKKVCIKVFDG